MVFPNKIEGKIKAIPSKAHAHRLLIASALSQDETLIHLGETSLDIETTIQCLIAMGSNIEDRNSMILVKPTKEFKISPLLDFKESGSTSRFLLPVAAAQLEEFSVKGAGRLPQRPLGDLIREMKKNGCSFSGEKLPFQVKGKLEGGRYFLPGDVSSQYISGLLMALPLLKKDSLLHLTSLLESEGYVALTLAVLEEYGILIKRVKEGYKIPGNQHYRTLGEKTVEGDWSNAAFFLALGVLGGGVEVTGLNKGSLQPDAEILSILEKMGADIEEKTDSIVSKRSSLDGIQVDLSQCPDLMPIIAVLLSVAKGKSEISGGKRLRLKESDRIAVMAKNLRALGANVVEKDDGLNIIGVENLRGGPVEGANDHRIVMAMAVASAISKGPILITDHQAVNKSYPGFFRDFEKVGGKSNVI
jgi:3-phosphoshikimate 1-carboxyvinyltransferase